MRRYAALFARGATAFSPKWCESFPGVVESAAAYHDLGKLDKIFQDVLEHNRRNKHGFNHVDAGVAHLLSPSIKAGEVAAIVFSHHIGLPSYKHQINNDKFRDHSELNGLKLKQCDRTDSLLTSYLGEHNNVLPAISVKPWKLDTGLVRRLALSCLVDADHSDTARHYRNERELLGLPLRAVNRLRFSSISVSSLRGLILPSMSGHFQTNTWTMLAETAH